MNKGRKVRCKVCHEVVNYCDAWGPYFSESKPCRCVKPLKDDQAREALMLLRDRGYTVDEVVREYHKLSGEREGRG